MKITTDQDGNLELTQLYNSIKIVGDPKEIIYLCQRDGGFEFTYGGKWYRALNGEIKQFNYVE
jgi:hypothetical protein